MTAVLSFLKVSFETMFPIEVFGAQANSTSIPFYDIGNFVPEGVIQNLLSNVTKGNAVAVCLGSR